MLRPDRRGLRCCEKVVRGATVHRLPSASIVSMNVNIALFEDWLDNGACPLTAPLCPHQRIGHSRSD